MILLFKFVSINILCSPVAANPTIVYPLLIMAFLDALVRSRPEITVTLVVLHIAVLVAAGEKGVLCMRGADDGQFSSTTGSPPSI